MNNTTMNAYRVIAILQILTSCFLLALAVALSLTNTTRIGMIAMAVMLSIAAFVTWRQDQHVPSLVRLIGIIFSAVAIIFGILQLF